MAGQLRRWASKEHQRSISLGTSMVGFSKGPVSRCSILGVVMNRSADFARRTSAAAMAHFIDRRLPPRLDDRTKIGRRTAQVVQPRRPRSPRRVPADTMHNCHDSRLFRSFHAARVPPMALSPTAQNPGLPILGQLAPLAPLAAGPAARPKPTAALADDARRDGGARLGRGRRRLRHRRRLRRSSELRHGAAGPAAGERGLSRGDPQPARLAHRATPGGRSAGRGCSSPSAPATWTR